MRRRRHSPGIIAAVCLLALVPCWAVGGTDGANAGTAQTGTSVPGGVKTPPGGVPAQATNPAGERSLAAVTKGRETGAPYGEPLPRSVARQAEDDPEAREEALMRQRAYPFESVPAGAYANAAEEYVRLRELVRRRHLARQNDARLAAPESLPTGAWGEVGPSPIHDQPGSQTELAFGDVSGRISAVAIDPADPGVVVIGASRGGLWRSADGGDTWTPVGDGLTTLVIADVDFAPSDPQIVYAATGDDDSNFWGAGVEKSTDGGVTWARIDNGTVANGIPNGTVLSKLVVDPVSPDRVIVAGYVNQTGTGSTVNTSIFRTIDGGLTWTKATIPASGGVARFKSLVIEVNCPANLWAIDYLYHTLIRSTDGGASWATVAASGLPSFTSNTKIAVHHPSCAGSSTLYASVQSGSGLAGTPSYPGVYRSTDGGLHWSLPGALPGPSGGCVSQCTRYDHELFVDPSDPNRLYMLGRDVWTSDDAGATWVNRSAGFDDANNYYGGNMHVDLHDAAILGTGDSAVVYVAGDGGLWSYEVASNTFTNRNGNLAISELTDLAVDPDTPNRAIGGLQDNGSIEYLAARAWTARLSGDGGDGGWLRTVPGNGNPVDGGFTTYIGNHGYISTDAGATWSDYDAWANNGSFNNEGAEFYAPWVATLGNNRVWHGARSLWYCDFPGTCAPQWNKLADNLAGVTSSADVSKIAIYNPAPGVFGPYYVANAFSRGFLESPNGTTWNIRTGSLPNRYISDIAFDPGAPEHVWVTLQGFGTGHVWSSPDGGVTWLDKSGDLPNVGANDILLDPADAANTWYVATDVGVFGTADAGTTWSVVGNNLPAVWATDLDLGPGRVLYAATGGRSVWKIALPGWVPAPAEVSGSVPLLLGHSGADLRFSWEDPGLSPQSYNLYEGELGIWYSHQSLACRLAPPAIVCGSGRCETVVTPGKGNRYYLITGSGPGGESPASDGASWSGPDHVSVPLYAVPAPCGGL